MSKWACKQNYKQSISRFTILLFVEIPYLPNEHMWLWTSLLLDDLVCSIEIIIIYGRKWRNRHDINNTTSYADFLKSIKQGNVESGLWTVELLKLLKDYDFRYSFLIFCSFPNRCAYCTTNTNPSAGSYEEIDFYDVYIYFAFNHCIEIIFERWTCSNH